MPNKRPAVPATFRSLSAHLRSAAFSTMPRVGSSRLRAPGLSSAIPSAARPAPRFPKPGISTVPTAVRRHVNTQRPRLGSISRALNRQQALRKLKSLASKI